MSDHKNKQNNYLQIGLLILILAAFGLSAWLFFKQYDQLSAENLNLFVASFGAWAPVVFVLLYTISSPIPFIASFMSAAAGLLFGVFTGTILSITAATLSGLIPFYLARSLGREWVEGRIKNQQLHRAYEKSTGRGGFMFVLLMRLVPVLPWEVQNYVAGLTKVKIPEFLLGTVIGIIPGSFALNFLGDSISDPTSWEFLLAIGLNVIACLIPAGVLLIKRRIQNQREEESKEAQTKEEADEMGT
jgi:uncharacterized membrane protein YdjX (TVP38/TMEM64 family)